MKAFLVIQYLQFWFCCISFCQNTFTMEKSTKYVASSSEILVWVPMNLKDATVVAQWRNVNTYKVN